jgi:hypothetical protein
MVVRVILRDLLDDVKLADVVRNDPSDRLCTTGAIVTADARRSGGTNLHVSSVCSVSSRPSSRRDLRAGQV